MLKNNILWEQFIKGDIKALEIIYNNNFTLLYNYGKKFTNDANIIKDCMQELFYNLINQRIRLTKTTNIQFYLTKSFRRLIIKKTSYTNKIIFPIEKYDTFNFEINIEETLINNETRLQNRTKVLSILNSLPTRQKEIIFLKFYLNMSHKEISKIMGINYQSVRTLLYRTLKTLRETK